MRKVSWLVLVALAAAAAIWYGRRVAEKSATVAVTSLLPAETLFVVQVPDFNQTRAQWQETDIYKIRDEPAVREFLQKPLSKIPKTETARQNLAQFEKLRPKDIFFAITSWANGVKGAAGFRFQGEPEDAERFVSELRAKLLAKSPEAKTETVDYQQHQIQTITAKGQTLVSAFDGDWFLATNDPVDLKTIIDRVDGRLKDRAATLAGDAEFSAAFKHMPSSYAAMTYGRLDRYIERVMPLLGASSNATGHQPIYRKMRAFCGALSFDRGKIRDTLFVGMPQLTDNTSLTRSSLALGTKETFLYLATFLNLPGQTAWPAGGTTASGIPGMMQKFIDAVSSRGVTLEEWNAAFGAEIGVLGDWANGAQWPALIATVPVKDAGKADQVFTRITSGPDGASTAQQRDGARFFTARNDGMPFSIAPTIALSSKLLIAGTTQSTVEAAMKRSAAETSELSSSEVFRGAEHTVPAPKQAFFYVDSALLYTRLDAALRPLLLMGAAFVPAIGQNVDLNKIPPGEAITRHFSPIVMSQNYQGDGYVTESVGPITLYEAAAGAAILSGGAAMLYQHGPAKLGGLVPSISSSTPPTSAPPSPSPSGTP
jgi:hypothetical protein